jgi:hypothetical protein
MSQDPDQDFVVVAVTRRWLDEIGFDVGNTTDAQMEAIAHRMADRLGKEHAVRELLEEVVGNQGIPYKEEMGESSIDHPATPEAVTAEPAAAPSGEERTYAVHCHWEMAGTLQIPAASMDAAILEANTPETPLPSGSYGMDSFQADEEATRDATANQ